MSSHLNYCRHCRRIATTPTGLTGKVNKLLKMKNSAGESRVIYSLHLLFLLVFPTPPLVLAFLFSFFFYGLPRCHAFTAACIVLIFVDFFISLSVFFVFYVCFSIQISFHTLLTPLFLFSPYRYIGVLTTGDKLSVLTP